MAKSSGVVAPESPLCSGRRNDFGSIDGRILEKGFIRERKRVSKTLGNNRDWKVNILFGFRDSLHPWSCSRWLDAGHPWRWITGRFGCEERFKGANSSGARSANVMEGTGWGRFLDLVDDVFNQQRSFIC